MVPPRSPSGLMSLATNRLLIFFLLEAGHIIFTVRCFNGGIVQTWQLK